MDLVDIDQVLDNLELNEEAASQRQRAEERLAKGLQQKCANGVVILSNTNISVPLHRQSPQIDNKSMPQNHTNDADETDSGFQPLRTSAIVANCKKELAEYEREVEESQDIQKYSEPVKSNNKVDANNVEQLHIHCAHENEPSDSSESLTTSSPSTFSSGPSLEGDTSPDLSALQTVPLPAEPSQTETVDDLTECLSSVSINASNNLQKRSILPLETMASSSALVKVLDNITESNVVTKSALSQLLENQQKQQREVATAAAVDTSLEPHKNPNRDNKEETRVKVLATAATNASKQQPQMSAMQPITFCSTMDDISDTELDSMLQEMDIDDDMEQQQQKQQHPQPLLSQEPSEVCQQQLQQHCETKFFEEGVFKESVLACEESSLGAGADYLNGDSFSQASTVEFSEVRVPKQPDVNMEDDDEDLPHTTTTTTTTTATIDSLGSNSSKADSISSSEESDSSSLEVDIIQEQQQLEDDLSKIAKCSRPRPQRPTTLNLPSLKSLDLYANAGQTPPGNETEVNEEVISPQTPSPEEQRNANTAEMTYEPHGVVHLIGMNNDVAEATGYSEDPHVNLGKVPPIWVPDNMATGCMQCSTKFTMIKRRHHCRACGKVLCSVCCSQKYKLEFLNEPDSRVCVQCYLILTQRGANAKEGTTQQVNETQTMDATAATNAEFTVTANSTAAPRSPNPNNPMEYCSTIPPHQQVSGEPKTPPSVIVPVGVLKKDNAGSYSSNSSNSSGQKARKRKSVMFSDGIAPGSDLATVDQWNEPKQPRRLIERLPKNSSSNNSNKNNKPPTPGKGSNHEHIADTSAMGMMAQFFRGAIPPVIAANTLHTIQQSALNLSSHLSKAATGKSSDAMEATPKIKPDSNKLSAAAMKTNEMLRAKRLPPSGCDENGSFIPHDEAESLPPIVIEKDAGGCDFEYKDIFNNYDLVQRLQKETLKFAVQKNLFVWVKIIHLKCCLNRTVINFTTQGMHHVGNDEIVVLLEVNLPASKEDMACKPLIPKDVFLHFNEIYNNADQGNPITELSHTNPQTSVFLGSRYYGGFIYIRPTYQCMQDVIVPENPYLIGILIHRNEVPWAKVFPLRLMLRLGAQFRYYPCPHVSIRQRESVYGEIAQTIINFLADFRNYSYTLPFIRGMYIHMEHRQTTVVIPRNRLEDVIKAVNDSSDHILAFGGNFSKTADGHLVCMQNVSEEQIGEMYAYSTQAINIQGQPRKVTGASFFVLNESLKTSSGLSGKCSIVEDGLMVQILSDKMEEVRNALKSQMDCTIVCGPVDADEQQTEIVCIKWVENDKDINIGVKSPIDDRLMDSVSSMRVHASFNYSNTNYSIRLTDIYVLKHSEWYNSNNYATMSTATTSEITRMTEQIARSASVALVPFLDLLVASKNLKIGLRFTLHQDNVCYEAGAGGSKLPPIYMNALDNHLIPTLHGISANIEEEIILELIFYILNV